MRPERDPREVGREMAAVFLAECERKAQHAPARDDHGFERDYVTDTLAEIVPLPLRRRYQTTGDAA